MNVNEVPVHVRLGGDVRGRLCRRKGTIEVGSRVTASSLNTCYKASLHTGPKSAMVEDSNV